MSALGEVIQVNAVRFVRKLPGPIGHVWSHLTDCGKLAGWFGEDGRIEPREGGAVWLMGGHVRGVVTQWRPQRRLAYTWNVFEPGDEESQYPESYLTIELQPDGADVALTLFHVPVPERFDAQTRMGWHTFLDMIEDAVSGRPPQPRETYMKHNAERYGVDMDNLAR